MSTRKLDEFRIVPGLPATTSPSGATPLYVNLRNVSRVTAYVHCVNTTGVTGSAITLSQATAGAGTGTGTSAKALAFESVEANVTANTNTVATTTAVSSNTFTTTNTNSVTATYVIDIDPATLDSANNFDCVRVSVGNGTNTTVSVHYILHMRYGGPDSTINPFAD